MNEDPIFVTQPSLPNLHDFLPYLEKIWENKILTNGGPFHQELERTLCEYLGVKFISLFSNGTIALIAALQALEIEGDVITTPYSFVATTHSLIWNKNNPVFVDIDPLSLNLDPSKIEASITPKTSAIMPVHCYGNPCEVVEIERIASKYNLKVIYDAAHSFGVKHQGQSVLNFGDLSVLSFHATKVFNTFEGGAIISHNWETKRRIDNLKNFGFKDEVTVISPGINGKMSEINAAFGLLQLQEVREAISKRSIIDARYRNAFLDTAGIACVPNTPEAPNFSYFPILVGADYCLTRDQLYEKLKSHGIFARRYFYPLISDFPMYSLLPSSSKENLPVASLIANQILCLPIYPALEELQQQRIIDIINNKC